MSAVAPASALPAPAAAEGAPRTEPWALSGTAAAVVALDGYEVVVPVAFRWTPAGEGAVRVTWAAPDGSRPAVAVALPGAERAVRRALLALLTGRGAAS